MSTLIVEELSTRSVDGISTLLVDKMPTVLSIHQVNAFRTALGILVDQPPYHGNQRAFAQRAGIDRSLLHHVLSKDIKKQRRATPVLVGRLCAALPAGEAATLLQAFLTDIVAEVEQAEPLPPSSDEEQLKRAPWHAPLRDVDVRIDCRALGNAAR